jgi:lipid-A-disaccharide synthase
MVVGYRVDAVAARLQFLVKTPHFALSNLVVGERAFPELMQDDCTPEKLADALAAVLADGAERHRQLVALERVPALMHLGAASPSARAAAIVLEAAAGRRTGTRAREMRP